LYLTKTTMLRSDDKTLIYVSCEWRWRFFEHVFGLFRVKYVCYRVLLYSQTITTSSTVEFSKFQNTFTAVRAFWCTLVHNWYIVESKRSVRFDFLSLRHNTITINNTGFLFFCKTDPFSRERAFRYVYRNASSTHCRVVGYV